MLPGKEREDHSSREKGLAKGLASGRSPMHPEAWARGVRELGRQQEGQGGSWAGGACGVCPRLPARVAPRAPPLRPPCSEPVTQSRRLRFLNSTSALSFPPPLRASLRSAVPAWTGAVAGFPASTFLPIPTVLYSAFRVIFQR